MLGRIAHVFLLGALPLTPAVAHHSKAHFLNETIGLQGEVVSFRWANPHAIFSMTVTGPSGKTTEWEVEAAATPTLARSGWTEDSLNRGEHVVVRAQPDRNRARPFAAVQSVLKLVPNKCDVELAHKYLGATP